MERRPMAGRIFEVQGYAIALDKVVFVTRVFQAEGEEGYQFNIRFGADLLLAPKYPTRPEAEMQRGLLVRALRES